MQHELITYGNQGIINMCWLKLPNSRQFAVQQLKTDHRNLSYYCIESVEHKVILCIIQSTGKVKESFLAQ